MNMTFDDPLVCNKDDDQDTSKLDPAKCPGITQGVCSLSAGDAISFFHRGSFRSLHWYQRQIISSANWVNSSVLPISSINCVAKNLY